MLLKVMSVNFGSHCVQAVVVSGMRLLLTQGQTVLYYKQGVTSGLRELNRIQHGGYEPFAGSHLGHFLVYRHPGGRVVRPIGGTNPTALQAL